MIANFHAKAIEAMEDGTLHSFYGRRADAVEATDAPGAEAALTELEAYTQSLARNVMANRARARAGG